MDLDYADFAASQRYFPSYQESLPTYELISFNTHLPPPYPSLDTSVAFEHTPHDTEETQHRRHFEASEDKGDQPWEFVMGRFSLENYYWTRTVKTGDGNWYQYGISERQSDGRPDFFFTCKMKPRRRGNERSIRDFCEEIAAYMRKHRSGNYNRCTCTFRTWQRRNEGSAGCHVRWYHLDARTTNFFVSLFMRAHDCQCSCGCFDI